MELSTALSEIQESHAKQMSQLTRSTSAHMAQASQTNQELRSRNEYLERQLEKAKYVHVLGFNLTGCAGIRPCNDAGRRLAGCAGLGSTSWTLGLFQGTEALVMTPYSIDFSFLSFSRLFFSFLSFPFLSFSFLFFSFLFFSFLFFSFLFFSFLFFSFLFFSVLFCSFYLLDSDLPFVLT